MTASPRPRHSRPPAVPRDFANQAMRTDGLAKILPIRHQQIVVDHPVPSRGSTRNVVFTPKEDLLWESPVFKLRAPDEAEAGSAGTQLRRGIVRWAHRDDEKEARGGNCAPRLGTHRTIARHALENPGGLGAGPQIKRSSGSLSFRTWKSPRFAAWGLETVMSSTHFHGANQWQQVRKKA